MDGTMDGLDATDRRRLWRWWLGGSVPSLLVYAWVLMVERWRPLQRQFFDDFFDVQARSLFDGHLDVPRDAVGFEGFVTDGRTYIYFGPVPALLRMPVLALTDRFDGRLTTLSMLAAAVVLGVAAFRLLCSVRRAVRGPVPVGPRECWATAGLAVAVLAGPPLLLASAAIVYHEATMWGLALSVAGYDAVLRWQRDPSGPRLLGASVLIGLALLSRQTIAMGLLAALGLVAVAHLVRRWEPRRAAALGAACLVPLVLVSWLNYVKFEQLAGVPLDRQLAAQDMGNRGAVLSANPSYTGLEYLPTTALAYLRPDGIDVRGDFPWIDFPREGPTKVGGDDVVFDVLDWSSSLPATAPALVALTIGGVVWLVRDRRRDRQDEQTGGGEGADDRDGSRLWPLYVGTLAGAMPVLVFAYVANRYLLDLYPIVLVGGIVGFHAASRLRPRAERLAVAGLGCLVAVGGTTNMALALELQNERGPVIPEPRLARWIDRRLSLPGDTPVTHIGLDDELPPVADGTLLAVGDCAGLYAGVRDRWLAVERGPGVGVHQLRFDLDDLSIGQRYPLATFGDDEQSTVVGIVRLDDDRVRVDMLGPEWTEPEWDLGGEEIDVDGGTLTLRLAADPRQPMTRSVYVGDQVVNPALLPVDDPEPRLGTAPPRNGVAQELPGGVQRVTHEPSLCRRALG